MKNRVFILLLSVVLTSLSCKRSDVHPLQLEVGQVEFAPTLGDHATTKAVKDVDFAAYGFYVAGYHTEGLIADALAANPSKVFPNVFDYDPTDDQLPVPWVKIKDSKYLLRTVKWKLDEVSYITYYAWAQNKDKDAVSGIVGNYPSEANPGVPALEIINASEIAKQTDIVAASYLNQRNNVVVSAVNLDFKHILAKLTFNVQSSSGAKVVFSKIEAAYGFNVYSEAIYQMFDNTFADLKAPHSGTNEFTALTIENGKEASVGDMFLIPQDLARGFLKFNIEYTLTTGTQTVTSTKSVDMPTASLKAGFNHAFTIDVTADEITVSDPLILGWVNATQSDMPLVAGPKGDVQLLLDGYDPPYKHSNGKWYWLDKSGYNRHVELENLTDAIYSTAKKAYSVNKQRLRIPHLGEFKDMTIDLTTSRTTVAAQTAPMTLNRNNELAVRIYSGYSSSGNVRIETGGSSIEGKGVLIHPFVGGDAAIMKLAHWTYVSSNSPNKLMLYHNANLLKEQELTTVDRLGLITGGGLGADYNGDIHYLKITNKVQPEIEVLRTYVQVKDRFKIEDNIQKLPPIRDNLVIHFDGYNEPVTENGKLLWKDIAGVHDNHAEIMTPDKVFHTGSAYKFITNGYMSLIKAASATFYSSIMSLLTFEIVFQSTSLNTTEAIMIITSVDNNDPNIRINTGESMLKTGSDYQFISEYSNTSRYRAMAPIVNPFAGKIDYLTWVNTRSGGNGNFLWLNGVKTISNGVRAAGNSHVFIGRAITLGGGTQWCNSYIKSIRIHNRLLTEEEVLQNYEFDKVYYGL